MWTPEDQILLAPFFAWSAKGEYGPKTEEELKASSRFLEAREEYADAIFEQRDAVEQIDIGVLCEQFGIKEICMECWDYDEEGNEIDEAGNIMPPPSREILELDKELWTDLEFPLVVVGHMSSSFDRLGNIATIGIDFVTLKDFALE